MTFFNYSLGKPYDGVGGGNDIFTKSLLHFDGVNGSTSYPDTAAGLTPNLVWTAVSNSLSTAALKFGTASLGNGSGTRYAGTPDNAAFNNLGATPFVFDCWGYCNAGGAMALAGIGYRNGVFSWDIYRDTDNSLALETPGLTIKHPTLVPAASWHHFACIFSGTQMWIALDGVVSGGNARGALPATSGPFLIGSAALDGSTFSVSWNGFIDEARLSIGTTRGWTTNFTPPTAPY